MSLSLRSRMYSNHDIPVLFTQLLLFPPWLNNGKYYSGGTWKICDSEQVGQSEAQVSNRYQRQENIYIYIVSWFPTFLGLAYSQTATFR